MYTHILRLPSSEHVLDTASGFGSFFSLFTDPSSCVDLLGGAEHTGTTDRIRTAGAMNRGGAPAMSNLSDIGMTEFCGPPALIIGGAAKGTCKCCILDPVEELGPIVLIIEEEDAAGGGLKFLCAFTFTGALKIGRELLILGGFREWKLTCLYAKPMFPGEAHSDFTV